MNSDGQAGHKGAPASRSSKQSKAECRDRVRTWAQPSPLGPEWLALCVDQGTDRQEQIDRRALRDIGRNDRLYTALATSANLQGERSTVAQRRTSGVGRPGGCQHITRATGERRRGDTRPPRADVSEKPTFRKAHRCVGGDDQVIEHAHVDQLQRGLQRLRQVLVGPARRRSARRMVVRLMCPGSLCAVPCRDGDCGFRRVGSIAGHISRRGIWHHRRRYRCRRVVVLKVKPRRHPSVVRRSVLYLLIDVSNGHLRHRKLCPGCSEPWGHRVTQRLSRLGVCCQAASRESLHDPIRSAGLLQSGRTAGHRFSCFASTKRLFVISHTRP